ENMSFCKFPYNAVNAISKSCLVSQNWPEESRSNGFLSRKPLSQLPNVKRRTATVTTFIYDIYIFIFFRIKIEHLDRRHIFCSADMPKSLHYPYVRGPAPGTSLL